MATQFFSLEEVSKNDGKNGNRVWIIIKGNVYDVTDYVNEHPGGSDNILDTAGRDATKDFNDVGHSSDAKEVMKKYKIGEMKKEEIRNPANSDQKKSGRSFCGYLTCGLCD